jgi:hypothetical protein
MYLRNDKMYYDNNTMYQVPDTFDIVSHFFYYVHDFLNEHQRQMHRTLC